MDITQYTVGDWATVDPVSTQEDVIMTEISKLFEGSSFHHLPVIDAEGSSIGIISKSDFYQLQDSFTRSQSGNFKKNNELYFRSLLVSDVMVKDVVSLDHKRPIYEALDIFLDNEIRSIIVLKSDKLYGILTPYDILKHIRPLISKT